jgi:hypothetical protein
MDDRLASDLVAMWRSELAAMAADRELRENWTGLLALWASAANAALPLLSPHDFPSRSAVAAEPAGSAPAAAASDAGLAAVQQLNQRIAELEQRLAEFERGKSGP